MESASLHVTTIPITTKPRSLSILPEPASNDKPDTLPKSNTKESYTWHTHFRHWIQLIAQSQRLQNWHAIPVSSYVLDCISMCQARWQLRASPISSDNLEDIKDAWRCSELQEALAKVPTSGYFLRLDLCSPKDTPGGLRAVYTIDQIISTLAQSARARDAVQEFMEEEKLRLQRGNTSNRERQSDHEGEDDQFMIYLMPWDDSMDCAREFRVFVPPKHESEQRISAISQYRWSEPSTFLAAGELDVIAHKVYDKSETLLTAIVQHVWISHGVKERDRLRLVQALERLGFVFDVTLTAEGEVQLLEINPFGAMSGCGSCLFQWTQDAAQLEGFTDQVLVAFRIA